MTEKRHNVKAIFKVACSIASMEAREEYLEQVCGDHAKLRDRVSTLLRMQMEEPEFLESPAIHIVTTIATTAASLTPGTTIGPYKILELIGEGGMGAVYLAEQKEPVRRSVALKLIKPGMDS